MKNNLKKTLLTLALLIFPFSASAASLDDLYTQIQSLLDQIASLEEQIKVTRATPADCKNFSADLSIGLNSTEVTNLQNFLIASGYKIPAGATGYFGGQTHQALVHFQKDNGVSPASGYFGPLTRAKLQNICATTAVKEQKQIKTEEKIATTTTETGTTTDEIADDKTEDVEETEEITKTKEPVTSAEVTSVSGSLNDYATFSITLELKAFGEDIYIPFGTDGVSYHLEDNLSQNINASSTAVVISNADEVDNYFFIPEDESREITLKVTFMPEVANTIARLQLDSINYSHETQSPNDSWVARPEKKYRTDTVVIVD